jgi:hypothetical protein
VEASVNAQRTTDPIITFAATAELERCLRFAAETYKKIKQIGPEEYSHLLLLLAAVETARARLSSTSKPSTFVEDGIECCAVCLHQVPHHAKGCGNT